MVAAEWRRVDLRRWHGVALVAFAAAIPFGEGVALACLALVALGILVRHRAIDWCVLTRGTIRTLLIAWGIWLGVGLAMTAAGGVGWLKPSELGVRTPLLAAPVVLLTATAIDRIWLRRAALAFMVVLLLACALGVAQWATKIRLDETFRGVSSVVSQGRIPGDSLRNAAGGFFFHRLKMAHVLVVGMGVLVARQLYENLSPARRSLELAAAAIMGFALLHTFARAALLGVIVGVVACILLASRRWRLAALLVTVLAVSVAMSAPAVRERALSIAGRQASSVRALIWSQGVSIMANHPIGAGLGNYPKIVTRYYDIASPHFSVRTYPHSVVLATWAEAGPLGLVAFVWAWFAFVVACIRRLTRPGDGRTAAATGLLGALALWVVGMTHDVLFHKPVALAYAGMLGLVLAQTEGTEFTHGAHRSSPRRPARLRRRGRTPPAPVAHRHAVRL